MTKKKVNRTVPLSWTVVLITKWQKKWSNNKKIVNYGAVTLRLRSCFRFNLPNLPLAKKQVADHLLFCNHSTSYNNFSILTIENKKFLLELKESLLIMRDKPSYFFKYLLRYSYWMDFFIIWSCVSVRAEMFALMVLFDLLSSLSWDWTLPFSRVVICLL